jgi:hypothetical protein
MLHTQTQTQTQTHTPDPNAGIVPPLVIFLNRIWQLEHFPVNILNADPCHHKYVWEPIRVSLRLLALLLALLLNADPCHHKYVCENQFKSLIYVCVKLHPLIYQAAACVACQRGLAERRVREWGQMEGAVRRRVRGVEKSMEEGGSWGRYETWSAAPAYVCWRMLTYANVC